VHVIGIAVLNFKIGIHCCCCCCLVGISCSFIHLLLHLPNVSVAPFVFKRLLCLAKFAGFCSLVVIRGLRAVPPQTCQIEMAVAMGSDMRFVSDSVYQNLFPAGSHVQCGQDGVQGRSVGASELGAFAAGFPVVSLTTMGKIAQDAKKRDCQSQVLAAAVATAAAAAAVDGNADVMEAKRQRTSRTSLTGVGIERRLSAVRASIQKATVCWEQFQGTENKEVLKKGKALKLLDDLVKMLDRQCQELAASDSVDPSLPELVNTMRKKASVTNMLFQIGTALKSYYIKGNAQQTGAAIDSLFGEIANDECLKEPCAISAHNVFNKGDNCKDRFFGLLCAPSCVRTLVCLVWKTIQRSAEPELKKTLGGLAGPVLVLRAIRPEIFQDPCFFATDRAPINLGFPRNFLAPHSP
jgi:hypothetical protein